jgi:hypothetical protein
MYLIKFEYSNPKCLPVRQAGETNTNDRNQKFKTSGSIVSDRSMQYFLFEHSSFEFVSNFVFRIFRQRRICFWQTCLAKLADMFTDNLF